MLIYEINQLIRSKNKQIEGLENRITRHHKIIKDLVDKNEDLENHIIELNEIINCMNETLNDYKDIIIEYESELLEE